MRLLSISRKRDVDVQNVLSLELYAVLLDLFYVNGAVRHIAKSNLSNEIEIKRYSPPSLWEIWSRCNCYWFHSIITIYWLEQVRKIFKCSWWNICKTLLRRSWMWSAGCNSWSIWFWIFNQRCWKKTPDRRLKSYTGNWNYPAGNYMFKVNNRNTRTRCEICSKLTIKIPERCHWRIKHISHLVLVCLLLTLSR